MSICACLGIRKKEYSPFHVYWSTRRQCMRGKLPPEVGGTDTDAVDGVRIDLPVRANTVREKGLEELRVRSGSPV